MTDNDNNNNKNDWNEYKLLVMDFIKTTNNKKEDAEKEINDLRLELATQVFSLREEFRKDIQEVIKTVTVLQVRSNLINGSIAIFISAAVGAIFKFMLYK